MPKILRYLLFYPSVLFFLTFFPNSTPKLENFFVIFSFNKKFYFVYVHCSQLT